MKNLFLTCAMMLLFVGAAVAQQTPAQTKKSTADTVHKSKSTKQTYKTDTVKKQHKNKSTKKSSSTAPKTSNHQVDTITGTKRP